MKTTMTTIAALLAVCGALLLNRAAAVCDNAPDSLQVTDVPALDASASGFKTNDVLTLVVTSTLVNGRSDAEIVMNASAPECNYPSGSYWEHTSSGTTCTETWTAQLPWATARDACGLSRSVRSSDGAVVFDAELTVTQTDALEDIRGTPELRSMVTGLSFELVFPAQVEVTSGDVKVFAPIDVVAAVTAQQVDAAGASASATLFTSVQWPFTLLSPAVNTTAPFVIVSVSDTVAHCDAGVPCTTTYTLALSPNGTCSISGTYTLSFTVGCNALYTDSDCPLQGDKGSLTFELVSGNLCATFQEDVDLSGTLGSYLSDFETARNAFLIGQTSYWVGTMSSAKVEIASSTLVACAVSFEGGGYVSVLEDGVSTTDGDSVNMAVVSSGSATLVWFHMDVLPPLFDLAEDTIGAATVKVTVNVTYAHTARRGVRGARTVEMQGSGAQLAAMLQAERRRQAAGGGGGQQQQVGAQASISVVGGALSSPLTTTAAADTPTQAAAGAASSSSNGALAAVPYVVVSLAVIAIACAVIVTVIVLRRRRVAGAASVGV